MGKSEEEDSPEFVDDDSGESGEWTGDEQDEEDDDASIQTGKAELETPRPRKDTTRRGGGGKDTGSQGEGAKTGLMTPSPGGSVSKTTPVGGDSGGSTGKGKGKAKALTPTISPSGMSGSGGSTTPASLSSQCSGEGGSSQESGRAKTVAG
ncbi:unnamed protein product, partial [Discosporangium mesarthrocarpum]